VPSGPRTFTRRSNSASVVSFGTEQPGARMNRLPAALLRGLPLLFQLGPGEAAETRVVQPSHEDS